MYWAPARTSGRLLLIVALLLVCVPSWLDVASAQRQSLDRNDDRFQQGRQQQDPADQQGDASKEGQQQLRVNNKGDRRTSAGEFTGGSSQNDDRNNRLSSTIFDRNQGRLLGSRGQSNQRSRGRTGGYPSLDYPPSMVGLDDPNGDPYPEPFNEDNEYYEPLSIRENVRGKPDSAVLSQRFGGPYDPSAENGALSPFSSITSSAATLLITSVLSLIVSASVSRTF